MTSGYQNEVKCKGIKVNIRAKVEPFETNRTANRIKVASPGQQLP